MSHRSVSAPTSGDAGVILGVVVVLILTAAVVVLVTRWRLFRAGEGAVLAHEAERWLRKQSRDG